MNNIRISIYTDTHVGALCIACVKITWSSFQASMTMGHSKSKNEEMRNEKWEMRKWGNGKPTADILLLQSSKESQCPCMHSLRDHLCLTVGTKGVCNGHCITVCKLILCIRVFHFWQVVSQICWIYELSILCSNFIQGVILYSFFLHLLACIVLYLSHIQHYY